MKVSVVIVNHATRDLLLACLESLRRFPPPCDHEAIVCDCASGDGSAEAVRRLPSGPRLVALPRNLGYAHGVNAGIRAATGDLVMVVNADVEFLAATFPDLLAFLAATPRAGVVAPRQVDRRGSLQLSWGADPTIASEWRRRRLQRAFDRGDLRERGRIESWLSATRTLDWVSGSALLVRREAIARAGLMDEGFFVYFEDLDWCRRIRADGWSIHLIPTARIVHHRGESMRAVPVLSEAEYRRSQIRYWSKHRGRAWGAFIAAAIRARYTVRAIGAGASASRAREVLAALAGNGAETAGGTSA